jgi:hypothetical protein
MERSIQEFKGIHEGQDIWVIARGASLNYVNPAFFDGKITIGINDIDLWYGATYLMRKEFPPRGDVVLSPRDVLIKRNTSKLVLAEYRGCVEEWGKNIGPIPIDLPNESRVDKELIEEFDIWTYKTPFTHGELNMPDIEKGEELPSALSSTAMAMYLAYFMGAKNIILCGNDECKLDGKDYVDGQPPYACGSDHTHILNWQASQSIVVRDFLRKKGINIYSLHPFINLRMEGHTIV